MHRIAVSVKAAISKLRWKRKAGKEEEEEEEEEEVQVHDSEMDTASESFVTI